MFKFIKSLCNNLFFNLSKSIFFSNNMRCWFLLNSSEFAEPCTEFLVRVAGHQAVYNWPHVSCPKFGGPTTWRTRRQRMGGHPTQLVSDKIKSSTNPATQGAQAWMHRWNKATYEPNYNNQLCCPTRQWNTAGRWPQSSPRQPGIKLKEILGVSTTEKTEKFKAAKALISLKRTPFEDRS